MKLTEIYKKDNNTPVISIEVFPPKPSENVNYEEKIASLEAELKVIKEKVDPSLISITYGAGGSNREKSNTIVEHLIKNFDFKAVMPHFTCVCSSKDYIEKYLDEIKKLNVKNILALRGDEPNDIDVCYQDFKFASELVKFIKQRGDFDIAVAGYPEGHIRAKSFKDDLENLKRKIDLGGKVVFTQLFFDNNKFFSYLEKVRALGIETPVAAGILPVVSYQGLIKMSTLSGVELSPELTAFFGKYKDSKEDTVKAGTEWATKQVEELIRQGVDGIHFYSLNKAHSVVEIMKNIGLKV